MTPLCFMVLNADPDVSSPWFDGQHVISISRSTPEKPICSTCQYTIRLASLNIVCRRSSELAATLDELEHLGQRFSLLTENSPRCFAESIYHKYLSTINSRCPRGFRSLIDNAITQLSTLENSAWEYEHVVLNLAGVRKEMAYVQTILTPIGQLIYWLEDILCEAMIDLDSLQVKYDSQELAFHSDNF